MKTNNIARASVNINAPGTDVWDALVNPEKISQYMFGATVDSDWKEGSPITWKGTWEGKSYEDKGTILQLKPTTLLQYTHYSPLSGHSDLPENYHTVTLQLTPSGEEVQVSLSQDNNETEEARDHSEKNWEQMLMGLKTIVEATSPN